MSRTSRPLVALLCTALVAGAAAALAPSASAAPPAREASDAEPSRFIVHFEDREPAARDDHAAQAAVDAVGRQEGRRLSVLRRLATGGALVEADVSLDEPQARGLLNRLRAARGVIDAEADAVMTAALSPGDPSYGLQWHYAEPVAGMNLPGAWDVTTGTGVVVAVLDTGITAHPDLTANVVPGWDFVSNAKNARDGNGRDSNPSDEGDWTKRGECGGGPASDSSWHGTHVAGTVAALSNTAGGVGVAFGAKVQPVRVLAKCGGTLSDIADAIVWSSGGQVGSMATNPTPARVINMSLGGGGLCGSTYQLAIDRAVANGTTVVVAAGNSGAPAANYQPASCRNVVTVAASDRQGLRAWYSNYGGPVDLAAPGGETATPADGVYSTLNSGRTTPGAPSYAYYQGTSMATPHVAGLAALVLSRNVGMTPLNVEARLKSGTRALPDCHDCGAGLVDATKTLNLVP